MNEESPQSEALSPELAMVTRYPTGRKEEAIPASVVDAVEPPPQLAPAQPASSSPPYPAEAPAVEAASERYRPVPEASPPAFASPALAPTPSPHWAEPAAQPLSIVPQAPAANPAVAETEAMPESHPGGDGGGAPDREDPAGAGRSSGEAAPERPPAPAATEPNVQDEQALPPPPEAIACLRRLSVRLTSGEQVPVALLPDETAAHERANELIRRLAETPARWPLAEGRYLRPEAIVSIDVTPL